ncbi:MAG: NifB/NifX family molybdenum-iron cluster-binding protein [Fibrobacterota bacterium]
MKIAITAQDNTSESAIDKRFGRAQTIAVYDTDSRQYAFYPNTQNLQATQGAGIQAAGNVVNLGCTTLLTGHCGPKAFVVLQKSGVQVYTVNSQNVAGAVQDFLAGRFTALTSPDVEGHW